MPLKSSSILYTSQGNQITLGKKLGEGGEGYVCAVNEQPQQVAKIYHITHLPDADKQAKLRYMIANVNEDLLQYTAWATDTLHKSQGGRIIGFLMPRIVDCHPIHTLYNPSYRRNTYPTLTWRFLIYTARNLASAVNTLHKEGHVIGDINQGNLLFSKDSKVILIDTDSFQISTPTTTHLSLVGVAHFTPPERQGNTNFDTVPRTQNHDNFGLAVLIFHLLFGGRHPYAGVPLISEAGNLLEHDIKAYRYAYAADHVTRGIKPPPASIPIDIVPKKLQSLFIQAFTESGAITNSKKRPTAKTWMNTLDAMRTHIKVCHKNKQHEYSKHLAKCPWCELDNKGVVYFRQTKTTKTKTTKATKIRIFKDNIEGLHKACSLLPSYYASTLPRPNQFVVTAKPFTKAKPKTHEPLFSLEPKWIEKLPFNQTSTIGIILSLFLYLIIFIILLIMSFAYAILIAVGVGLAIVGMAWIFYHWTQVPTRYTAWMGGFYTFLGIVVCFSPIWYVLLNKVLQVMSEMNYKQELQQRKDTLNAIRQNYVVIKKEVKEFKELIEEYHQEKKALLKAYHEYRSDIRVNKGKMQPNPQSEYQKMYTDITFMTMQRHLQNAEHLQQKIEKAQARQNSQDYASIAKQLAQAEADYQLMVELEEKTPNVT